MRAARALPLLVSNPGPREQKVSIMLPKIWVRLLGVAIIFVGVLAVFLPPHVAADGSKMFPNTELITQDGKTVHFYDDLIKGKIVAIDLMYTSCQYACPLETARMAQVQKILGDRVGKDIFMTSISLKPEHDTRAVLKEYADMFKARPGWSFLSGKPDDVEHLRRSLGFTNLDPRLDKDTSQHIGNVRMGNEPLMLWAACPGMARPEFIAKSILWMVRKG